jgi:hypothetical protein
VRRLFVGLLLSTLIATTACGGGGSTTASSNGALSGNWQIALARQAVPTQPLTYTGFLTQSGDSVGGNLILGSGFIGSGCSGVGPVTGTVNGQNLSLIIDEFGEDVSLTGTVPSTGAPMNGEFSFLAGGCNAFPGTGTWSAFQVPPINGTFHGTFTSTLPPPNNGTFDVVGTLTQGPNTGGSTANLKGNISVVGTPHFCSYLSTATITGLISGTSVSLNLFGPDGSLITQIGQIGQIGNPEVATQVTVTADASSLSGPYTFPAISASCNEDQGTFQVTFP